MYVGPKKNCIHERKYVTWLKRMYYDNVLPEPDITTGIANKDRQRDDTNGPYNSNYKAVEEDIYLDDDHDDDKSIPNLLVIIQGNISDDEYDYRVEGNKPPIEEAKN